MGARHFHANALVAKAEFAVAVSDVRHAIKPARKPLFVHAAADSEHAHDDLQRHHHDVRSPNAVFVNVSTLAEAARAELDASSSKAGASLLPLVYLTQASWPDGAVAVASPWVEASRWSLQTAEPRTLRRPPRV